MRDLFQSTGRVFGLLLLMYTGGSVAGERSELDGVWLYTGSQTPEELHLTAAGQAALDHYVPLRDDNDLRCLPGSFTNIMHTPSPPFEIRQHDGYVEMNYEYMDVKRRVPLDAGLRPEAAPYTANYPGLGRSVGRYDGATLVVETVDQAPGVLDTLSVPGLPKSKQMRTEERFTPEGDDLKVTVTHHDPVNYSQDLVVSYSFHRFDGELLEWGCEPDEANYDRFRERDHADQ
jgi:hypothetical protein